MQTEKLVDAAIDLRDATLRAREQGIISYTGGQYAKEEFQIYDKDNFKEMIETREYRVTKRDDEYRYQYNVKVAGLNFICITPFLFKEEDKEFIVTEEEDV